ncbi:MAG: tetratricopeptide repeat protein [Candidatus Aminicenantes bacterium]|nr:tetratricopeptide repeat protein [Candidatus Aminicenantes bacterium]
MKMKTTVLVMMCMVLSFCASPEKKLQRQRQKDPRYQYNLALFYLNNGNPDEAIKYFQKSISLDSQHFLSYNGMGIAYLMKVQFELAIKYFEKCLKINPTLTEAHNYLGTAYQEIGLIDKAEKEYRTATEDLNYQSRELPFYNLARLYFTQNRFEDALYYVQKSIEANSQLVMAHNLRGVIFERIEDYEAAIDSYKRGLKISEDDIDLKFNLAVAYFKNKEYELAKEFFDQIYSGAELEMKKQIDGYRKMMKQ